jgi:plasmid stabilization system protein ParE
LRALLKHPLLDCDLEEAALWYHLRSPAAAERLIDEAQRVMRLAAERPEQFRVRFAEIRAVKLRGFPHSVYFTVTAESVEILALLHGARDVPSLLVERKVSFQL